MSRLGFSGNGLGMKFLICKRVVIVDMDRFLMFLLIDEYNIEEYSIYLF